LDWDAPAAPAKGVELASLKPAPPVKIVQSAKAALPKAASVQGDVQVAEEWEEFPDGAQLLAFDTHLERYARAHENGDISIHDVKDKRRLARLPGPGDELRVGGVQFSLDGHYLGAWYGGTGKENRVKVWDARRGEIVLDVLDTHRMSPGFTPD